MSHSSQVTGRIVPDPKSLILIMGVPGSGKTALAKALLDRLVCVYLDNNFVADAFFAETRTDPEYVRLRPRLYSVLYRIAEENLRVGNSVMLDAPHVTHVQDPNWCDFIQKLGVRNESCLIVVRCRCSEATLRKRLETRGETRDRWKLENWQEFQRREPMDVPIPFGYVDADTDVPLSTTVERVWAYILARLKESGR